MRFNYKAKNSSGGTQRGIIDASSKRTALELLLKKGFHVLELKKLQENEFLNTLRKLWEGVKPAEFVLFSRQLSVLIDARVPLLSALQTIGNQTQNSFLASKINLIMHDVDGGSSFSEALARHPDVFSNFYVNMVKAGEASGTLQKVLNDLADNIEKNYELTARLKSAMYYPGFILFSMFVTGFIVMTFVMPKLLTLLEGADKATLPIQTRVVIWTSNFLADYWWAVLIVLIAIGGSLVYYSSTEDGKAEMDRILLKIPFINKILNDIYIARFSENFSTLLQSGLPITTALLITSDIVGNEVYREVIREAAEHVKRGESIGEVFARYEVIPPIVAQMIQVGESTGRIDFTLSKITDFYVREADVLVKNFSSLIEPIIMIILAVGVGILVSSVMLPIYQVATSI
ncbi:MAG: type II secretion system F family protein [Patescibacteria group bacterium]|jgi:type IV pilus assembly protein PilC|nr:type II secretion system F family protein [Patescibacteria group bacterium]